MISTTYSFPLVFSLPYAVIPKGAVTDSGFYAKALFNYNLMALGVYQMSREKEETCQ